MNGIEQFLYMILIMMIIIVIALIVVFVILKKKEKERENQKEDEVIEAVSVEKTVSSTTKIAKEYDKKSIFDFMEFDSVKDNMIVQKGGKKFLMAIECKGINYDLMSEVEKAATEQGFSAFLNSLRDPIQIYIQTRTVNLEKNIEGYKERVEKLRDDINLKEFKLKEYSERPNIDDKTLKNKEFELLRQKNLYSYGADVISDTKKMSLNKNVLKKKYYIIIRYFYDASDTGETGILSEEEIREIAFSRLYTQAISISRVLSGIGITSKALNTFELAELLYNAYNRDDSEVFSIEKALEAGYDELCITADNIIDKKIVALNNEAYKLAQDAAKKAIEEVADERNKDLKEIEENLDTIIEELAKVLIQNEGNNIPEDIKDEAIEKINKKSQKKKGGEETNGKQNTKESGNKRRAS